MVVAGTGGGRRLSRGAGGVDASRCFKYTYKHRHCTKNEQKVKYMFFVTNLIFFCFVLVNYMFATYVQSVLSNRKSTRTSMHVN